jgi:hypothetical protein
MPILETFFTGLAVRGVYDLTKEGAVRAYNALKTSRPDLIEKVEQAAKSGDDDALRAAIVGALEVAAATGQVEIQGAFLSAAKQATFDHQQGTISIGGTSIHAPSLVTGGGVGATGETVISGGTVLSSAGTSINVGHGASIRMTGGASIKQT